MASILLLGLVSFEFLGCRPLDTPLSDITTSCALLLREQRVLKKFLPKCAEAHVRFKERSHGQKPSPNSDNVDVTQT
ncbi:MAG TPA: hypothetical protein V6D11_12575 [Waterburya sp.]